MDKLVEFGYPVSKDYEKLWEMISVGNKVICFFDGYSERLSGVTKIENDLAYSHSIISCVGADSDFGFWGGGDKNPDKELFTKWCNDSEVTFIDPEPASQNAIYYSDGSVVQSGDDIYNIDGVGAFEGRIHGKIKSSFILIERGVIYVNHVFYPDDNILRVPVNECCGIKWERTTMTNVSKVME